MRKSMIAGLIVSGLFSTQVFAHQAGDVIVRAGIAVVAPNESSDPVATFGEFQVNSNTQLGINFAYMVTDNIGVELLAATPFEHDVSLAGVGKIAETKQLPPTLMRNIILLMVIINCGHILVLGLTLPISLITILLMI